MENIYTEDHFLHIFINDFRQNGKFTEKIAIHHAELIREKILPTNNLYLFHIYRLVVYIFTTVQFLVESIREKILFRQKDFLWRFQSNKKFKKIRKDKGKYRAAGDLDRQKTERTHRKLFRCL